MVMTVCCILSQSPNWKDNLERCKEFCIYLKVSDNANVPLFSPDNISKINNSVDFRQLFEIVNDHISWDEYYILTQIISECNSDEAEQELDKYKKKVAISKSLEIISLDKRNPPPGFEKFYVFINKPYKKLTVEEYEKIKNFVFVNLEVHCYVTNGYIDVLFDSLHIEWHVTTQATPHMIKVANERQAFFTKNMLIFMQIGKEIVINMNIEQISVSMYVHYCQFYRYIATMSCTLAT